MNKSKTSILLFTLSLLLGSLTANAACTGCVYVGPIDDDIDHLATYSAVVRYTTWHTNEHGQSYSRVNFLTLTGTSMAYCQQQLSAVMNSPGTSVVQFCQKD